MFANSQMMGMDTGFPDVCLTPAPPAPSPVPIPYPNIGMGPTAPPNAAKVLWMATPAHNMATKIPMTNGDNAGVATGVAAATVMGPTQPLAGSFTTLIVGMPATRLTSPSLQNSTNVPGVRIVPSQPKVMILAP